MRPTLAATDRLTRVGLIPRPAFVLCAALLIVMFTTAQSVPSASDTIDLTGPEPNNQQGIGVPGARGGSSSVGRDNTYELPIRLEIDNVSVDKSGDFILEVQLKNVGQAPFSLPVSRQISDVQRTLGSPRREFFFSIRISSAETPESWFTAVTAGSSKMPGSFRPLEPGEAVRALLRLESKRIRETIDKHRDHIRELPIRVVCSEWTLSPDSFFIQASAQDVESTNVAALSFDHGVPKAVVSDQVNHPSSNPNNR